jgi:hypothetical protein
LLRSRLLSGLLVLPVLGLAACGDTHVDTAKYTCGQFNKSLQTKNDNSAGTFIRDLRSKANLGQDANTERREITVGIILACRQKPTATKPADAAIATAKQIKAGKFKLQAPKKKSTK